jgi:hypothetical protein
MRDNRLRQSQTLYTIKLVTSRAPRQLTLVPDPDKAVGTELQIRDVYTGSLIPDPSSVQFNLSPAAQTEGGHKFLKMKKKRIIF